MRSSRTILIVIAILLLTQAGLLFVAFWQMNESDAVFSRFADYDVAHSSYFQSKEFYDSAYEQGTSQIITSYERVYGGVIPHHLIVKDKIAAFFSGLKHYEYETVVLIGPNHFNAGNDHTLVSGASWETPYGVLLPDYDVLSELLGVEGVSLEEDPFIIEHSISGLVPFIKKSLPGAKIVPIIVRNRTSRAYHEQLAERIAAVVDREKTLVLASVDFSHYMPQQVADFHDETSRAVIENFEFERLYGLEIDSPASLDITEKYLENIGAKRAQHLFSTNSGVLTGAPESPGTSHQIFYFHVGEPQAQRVISMLFFGNVMFDGSVKKQLQDRSLDQVFKLLAGQENRFFLGPDIVFVNVEGPVTAQDAYYDPSLVKDFVTPKENVNDLARLGVNFFNFVNDHLNDQGTVGVQETIKNMRPYHSAICDRSCSTIKNISGINIGFLGVNAQKGGLTRSVIETSIYEIKSQADLVVVNVHWGDEYVRYPSQEVQDIAHIMIDAGADMIIGHHPQLVQGLEWYHARPIFSSLGSLLYDEETARGEGLAVGVSYFVERGVLKIYLYPFGKINNEPYLLLERELLNFLKEFATWSKIPQNIKISLENGSVVLEVVLEEEKNE